MPRLPTPTEVSSLRPQRPTPHPAKFTDVILHRLDELVPSGVWLDPFAGVGKVAQLARPDRQFVLVEIEPEWATQMPGCIVGDSIDRMFWWQQDGTRFDGVVTSPVYGNRMSDHHDAKDGSRRKSYKFDLGREPSEGSSATMYFWQEEYREFHESAWNHTFKVTRPGGWMFLNVKDFIRNGEIQHVVEWHMNALRAVGYIGLKLYSVVTPGMRDGENAELRAESEVIIRGRRP